MTATTKQDSIKAGVADAWDFWMSQHDVSMGDLIGDAVRDAVGRWLDAHSEELIEAIAAKSGRTS